MEAGLIKADSIIVGGGIMGLLLARELVQKGKSVHLIEKSMVGKEASWAGGGIVSPLYPWRYNDPITRLASWAQDAYPHLAANLYKETGIDPEFNACGLIMLDAKDSLQALTWSNKQQEDSTQKLVKQVPVENVMTDETQLAPGFSSALSMPHVGNIRNPRLLKSLIQSLKTSPNFTLSEQTEVKNFKIQDRKVIGVELEQGSYYAEQVAICSGAWSAKLTQSFGLQLPIKPIKGEMLIFEPAPSLIRSILLYQGRYLIPRKDGRIIVGSTLEDVGFDKTPQPSNQQALLESAYRIVPSLKKLKVEKHWAGLRPGAPAGLPYIGSVPGIDGLWLCAGHFRNGLVLAPASAHLMGALMLGLTPDIDPEPYRLSRSLDTAAFM